MDDEKIEFETVERLLKERDTKKLYIEFLENGDVQKVIELMKRDIETINETIAKK